MIFNKLAKSIFVIVLVMVFGQAAWAASYTDNHFTPIPEFKVQVRILDLILGKVDGKQRVTHMIAEVVNIADPVIDESCDEKEWEKAHKFVQENAKQVIIIVTPEAEKQGKLLGFFHPFINGVHKTGVFKADSIIKVLQVGDLDGWHLVMTECNLLDK